MLKMLSAMLREEDGQGLVEYGLIIAGIAIAAIVAVFALGPVIKGMFEDVKTGIDENMPSD